MKDKGVIFTIIKGKFGGLSKFKSKAFKSVLFWIHAINIYHTGGVKQISFLITLPGDHQVNPYGADLDWWKFMKVLVTIERQLENKGICVPDDISAEDLYKAVWEILQPFKINGLEVIHNNWERNGKD